MRNKSIKEDNALGDTLLPKLIFGEVRLKGAERFGTEARA